MHGSAVGLAGVLGRAGALVLSLVLCAGLARAQEDNAPSHPLPLQELTAELVERRQEELAADAELLPEVRDAAVELWNQTLVQLHLVEEQQSLLAHFEAGRLAAPEAIARLQQEGVEEQTEALEQVPSLATLAQLESGLADAQAESLESEHLRDEIAAELARRTDRRRAIPNLLADVQQRLAALDEEVAPADEAAEVREAREALARATRLAGRAEFDALSAERPFYGAEEALISLRLDAATRRRDRIAAIVAAWEQSLIEARQLASALAEEEARRDVEDVADRPDVVRQLAAQTEHYAVRRNELTELHAQATGFLERLRVAQERLEELRSSAQEKIAVAGYSNAVAVLLRKQRSELPEILDVLDQQLDLSESSTDIDLELIDRRRDRAALGQRRQGRVAETLAAIDAAARFDGRAPLEQAARAELEGVVRELLQSQHEGLVQLINELNRYFNDLNELEFAAEKLSANVAGYGREIDEHILWVRSAAPLSWADLALAVRGYGTLLSPGVWASIALKLQGEVGRHQGSAIWVGLLLWLLALLRPVSRRQIRLAGERLADRRLVPIVPTLVVTLLTVVRAALWPVLVWSLGWCLSWLSHDPVAASVGAGLMRLAPVLVPLVLLAEICRPMGLAAVHLRWPSDVLRSLRRQLWLWQAFVVPPLGLALVFDEPGLATYEAASGRLALMLALLGLTMVAQRLTLRDGPVMRALRSDSAPRAFGRLQRLWFPLTGLLPAALIVAVALGFQYGGFQVGLGLVHSATLVLALVVLRGVARRWLSLARLRLAWEQLQRRREAEAEAEVAASTEIEVSGEIRAVVDGPDQLDVGQIDEQAMRLVDMTVVLLLMTGLVLIWSDLLPALGGLRRVQLWESAVTSSQADGLVATRLVPVTLADLLLALLLAGFTLLATRNIAGLLEMTVLRRMTLEPGGGYAITTVCRYLLTAGGVVAVASLLGITWGSVQWLAAAVSVGLGFGLQEIFANFVSGLIILFERPIRVGDIITVGGIEGVVTKIRTRATTIRDRDRRELLVPNKEFITGQLVNWTLSDPISRLILPVGIAYGSDTELAERTLVEVARAQPMVLDNPPPTVVFRNFGDSTLDYELRVFIADRDYWPNVTHALNSAIHGAFAEQGIEIAFPQRDLHLRDGADEALAQWIASRQELRAAAADAPTGSRHPGDGETPLSGA